MAKPTVGAWLGYTGWWLFRKSYFINVAGKALRPLWLYANQVGQYRPRIDVESALNNLEKNAKMNFLKMVERNSLILNHEGVKAIFTLQPEIVFHQSKTFTKMEQNILDEMSTH